MKCPHCKKNIPDNVPSCPHCGCSTALEEGSTPNGNAAEANTAWRKADTFALIGLGLTIFSGFTLELVSLVFLILSYKKTRFKAISNLNMWLIVGGTLAWVLFLTLFFAR